MTKSFGRRTVVAALAGLALLAGAAPALAQSAAAKAAVDQAKAQGVVGEQADGFLGVVGGGDPAVRAAIAEINAGRAQAYREAAGRTGVTPEAAGQATARQLEARLPPGQFFRTASGQWERR
jgi:uncharacterized protein